MVYQSKKFKLKIDKEVCTGCRMCELFCSAAIIGNTSPDKSCISIIINEKGEVEPLQKKPCVCNSKPLCIEFCPVDAISFVK